MALRYHFAVGEAMRCYECSQEGPYHEAVALCHHCLAGLCRMHALTVDDPVRASEPICKIVVLKKRARLFFCRTCSQALGQTDFGLDRAGSERDMLGIGDRR